MELKEKIARAIAGADMRELPEDMFSLQADAVMAVLLEQEPAGYANGDELANMLNDRSALLWPCRDSWRTVPLYAAPVPPAESAVPAGWHDLLNELQWAVCRFNNHGEARRYCPICENEESDGHAAGCRIAAMLAAAPKPATPSADWRRDHGANAVRYCPECGLIGEVPNGARDCCPDGNRASMVRPEIAEQARRGFIAMIVDRLVEAQKSEGE